MMVEVLSASDTHRVVHHRAGPEPSERLVVTFAPKSDNFRNEGFGTRFALSRGHDTIYVAQTRFAWHQGIGHEELAAQVLPVAAGREIVAYGNSAGAYAALYFGGALNARILAVAPRNDIHPLITVSQSATRDRFVHHADLTALPVSAHAPIVIFDPHQGKDSRLVYRWAVPAYPEAVLHPVFGAGHNVIGCLQGKRMLGHIVQSVFRGECPGEISVWEPGSHHWHVTEGYLARKRGDPRQAMEHLHAARKLGRSMNLMFDIIQCASELGDTETAAEAARELDLLKAERRASKRHVGSSEAAAAS